MDSFLKVARDGYCSGCGACAFAHPSALQMAQQPDGTFQPELKENAEEAGLPPLEICPMSGAGEDETAMAGRLWPELPADPQIGRHRTTLAVHVADEARRMKSGSGGLVTWLAEDLLKRGEIDRVIHVRATGTDGPLLFEYAISRNPDDVRNGAKSRYYPVEMSRILQDLAASEGRAALVGVPCFIKAARGLISSGYLSGDQVPYMIGLVCGHLKSTHFAEYLAWQGGIAPGNLAWCDFREKLLDRPASDYGFAMRAKGSTPDQPAKIVPMADLKGKDWGEGLFRLTACEFCDDVLAECADIAIGDAWLPGFVDDPRGENVVVVRDARLAERIAQAGASGELVLSDVTPQEVARSQSSGLRHRREGLAHRLARRIDAGRSVPRKRVAPQLAQSAERRKIYDLRLKVAETSNDAFLVAKQQGALAQFDRKMAPLLRQLKRATYGSLPTRLLRRLKRELSRRMRAQ